MTEIIVLSAYDWDFSRHYFYNAKELPNKKELDKIWKIAYSDAKLKMRSGIRTEPDSDEILWEMVRLLQERDIYPLKIWDYDVENREMENTNML